MKDDIIYCILYFMASRPRSIFHIVLKIMGFFRSNWGIYLKLPVLSDNYLSLRLSNVFIVVLK